MSYRANIVLVTAIAILAPAPFALADTRAEAQAHYNKGLSLKKEGKLDEALKEYEEALKIEPKFTAALHSSGLIYKKKNDFEKAKKFFQDAIASSSEYGPSHLSLGQILLQEGTFEDCRKEFNLAIKGKEMTAGDKAEAYNGIGISYRYESKAADAIKAFDEANKLSENWIYYVNKGIAINQSKDKTLLPEGEKAYKKATELAPKEAATWVGLGINYRKQKKFSDAITAYEKGLAIKADDKDAWYDLAAVYAQKRSTEKDSLTENQKKDLLNKELKAWESYLKLVKPDSESAKDAAAHIEQTKKQINQ